MRKVYSACKANSSKILAKIYACLSERYNEKETFDFVRVLKRRVIIIFMVLFDEDKQNKRVDDLRKQEEEELAQTLSFKYGVPYLDLAVTPINIDALRVIGEVETRGAQIAVFNDVDKVLSVGALSPQNPKTVEALQ